MIVTLTSIVKVKLIALLIGPLGVGIISQINSLSSLVFAIIPIGSLGITKYIAEYYNENRIDEISVLLKYFVLRNLPVVIIIFSALTMYSVYFSDLIFDNVAYNHIIIFFSVSIPLGMLAGFIDLYFKGLRKIGIFVKYSILNSLISLILFIPLITIFEIEGAVIVIVLTYLVNIVLGIFLLKSNKLLPRFSNIKSVKVESKVKKDILKIGLATMLMLFFQQASFLVIKTFIVDNYGLISVGIYQSVFGISNNYFALFFSVIATYSLPKLSTLKNNDDKISEINQTLKLLLFLYTPTITILYVCRIILIKTLYTSEFLSANPLFFFQFLGDYLKALSWIFGLWLLPNLKIKQWLLFDLFNSFFFTAFSIFLSKYYKTLESFTIAYFVSYFVQAIVQYSYLRFTLKFKFMFNNFKSLFISVLTVGVIFILSNYDLDIGFIVLVPALTVWILLIIKKTDIVSLKELIYSVKAK